LRLLGQLTLGICTNNAHATVLEVLPTESTGQIQTEQEAHIQHDPVPVPDNANPFPNCDTKAQFIKCLQDLVKREYIPVGYGLLPEEWEGDAYPLFETLWVSRRGGKEISISLVEPVWMHRAILWCKACIFSLNFNKHVLGKMEVHSIELNYQKMK
jgi:hypothetical protein